MRELFITAIIASVNFLEHTNRCVQLLLHVSVVFGLSWNQLIAKFEEADHKAANQVRAIGYQPMASSGLRTARHG